MKGIKPSQRRCRWATTKLGIAYHDAEWGVPQHDDRMLFEFLILEGAQAGLSWETILRKRENYRKAFDRFDPAKVAALRRREETQAARRRRHHPQPPQDRRGRHECAKRSSRCRKNSAASTQYIWQFVGRQADR